MEQLRGMIRYKDSSDEGALGNRVQVLVESLVSGGRIYFWYVLILLISLLIAYGITCFIYKTAIHEHPWYLAMLHVFLYGMIFVIYGEFSVKYTNYGFEGLNLHSWNQFLILCLEMVAVFLCMWIQKNKAMLGHYVIGRGAVFTYLVCAYAAFAIIGNYLFMSSAEKAWTITLGNILIFCFFMAWITPYILAILLLLETNRMNRDARKHSEPDRNERRKLAAAIFLQALFVFGIYLIACNPGNMYTDAMIVLKEITTLPFSQLGFAFPIAISSFYKLIFMLIPEPIIITVIQILLAAMTETVVAGFFYQRGVLAKKIRIAGLIFSILPPNGIFVVTFTSNFYYTIACIMLTLLFVRAVEQGDSFWKAPGNIVKVLLGVLAVALTRNEGMITAALIAVVLLIKFTGIHKKKMIPVYLIVMALGVTLVTSGGFNWILQKVLNAYSTVGVDNVNAVAYYNGKLPDNTLYPEVLQKEYTIYEVGNLSPYSYSNNYPDIVMASIIHNPTIVLRNRLNKSDCVWDVLENNGIHTAREIIGIYANDMGVVRQNNILTTLLIYLFYPLTVAFCVTDVLFYRSGIYLILSLVLVLYWRKNHMKRGLLLLSSWSHALVLFLCLLWQCSRHTYPIMLCIILAFIYTLVVDRKNPGSEVSIETI
ncbi:MAG: hypothetical protein K5682_08120 [Lachnospiraceae bacterium]|nr:hypothetical protein [Lachnospiraceae bacterium]